MHNLQKGSNISLVAQLAVDVEVDLRICIFATSGHSLRSCSYDGFEHERLCHALDSRHELRRSDNIDALPWHWNGEDGCIDALAFAMSVSDTCL